MVPLALSSSVAVKVGHSYGLKKMLFLKHYAISALILIFIFSILTFSAYLLIPTQLIVLITDKNEVIAVAVTLMFYVALFQVPDALQACLQGILRGISVTKPTMWITIISGAASAPISYYFAFILGYEARGLWMALGIVLTIQFFCYLILLNKKLSELENSWLMEGDQKSPI